MWFFIVGLSLSLHGYIYMITCSRHSDGRAWVKNWLEKKMERDFPSLQCHIIFFPLFSFCVCCSWFTVSCSPPSESLEQATRYRNVITHYSTCIYNVLTVFLISRKSNYCMYLAIICHERLAVWTPTIQSLPPSLPPNLTLRA